MSLKERLKIFIKHKGISVLKFEAMSGLSNGYVNNINKSISDNKLEEISKAFPELNPIWLRMGEGEMLITSKNASSITDNEVEFKEPHPLYGKELPGGIPLIPYDAMAGFAGGDAQVMEYETERYHVPAFRGADFLIPVRGDSMAPRYNNGDIVACKIIQMDTFFQWDRVYVLDTDQGALIKRVIPAQDSKYILIVSENMTYEPKFLHKTQIRALALVIGSLRRE
jgi:repressor LexA